MSTGNSDELRPIFERPYTRRDVLKRGGAGALGLTLGGSLLAACGGDGDEAERAAAGARTPADTLVVGVEGDIDTFDPAFTVGSKPSQTTIQNVFDQLTEYAHTEKTLAGITYQGVDTEQIGQMLAESYEEQGDKVVFTLREGVTYHDGKPVTAEAIEQGYRRVYESQGISYFLLTMAGVSSPDQIRALDDRRIEFTLAQPNLLFLKNNTMHNTSAIHPEHAEEHATANDPWATEYFKKTMAIGNGPFLFEEYRPGDRIVLQANPDYYRGKPKLERVIQKIVPEATERVLLIKRGEVDMIMVPPVKELDDLREDPNLEVMTFPNPRNYMLELNNAMPPFDKKEVRQAVAYAVPYKNIIEDVFRGYAQENKSIVGNGMPGSEFSYWKYDTNLDEAARLLDAAGFPGGNGAPQITISIRADWEEAERSAVLIQSNLRQLGLNASIQKLAFAQFNEQEQGRKLQAFIDEWLSWVNDPFYHMSWILKSDSPTNYVSYKNDRVDEIITQWTLSTDVEPRLDAAREAQKLCAEDAPLVFLCGPNWNVVARKNVKGYVYYNDELNRYAYMSKEA